MRPPKGVMPTRSPIPRTARMHMIRNYETNRKEGENPQVSMCVAPASSAV